MKAPLVIGLALAAGCADMPDRAGTARIANPASEYCIEQGGRVELRQEANGTVGYCHLPDGRVVEEWMLFRSKTGGNRQ
ncbi:MULTISPECIES: DUF333 domain-containing protein [unclassified Pigmentiphaga]|uniref:putative hemolysin n=1 Tax=unclassified Pigmentiphaga TaxID=2626614 RepID=UPI000B408BF9|nr:MULTISPECIES: DUF333 domain-containing protein [unclassified Pigmentiphaga]OVZ62609.1 hypothetical protein CDO46_15465 [Pigmentiphaga sp. NML030171]